MSQPAIFSPPQLHPLMLARNGFPAQPVEQITSLDADTFTVMDLEGSFVVAFKVTKQFFELVVNPGVGVETELPPAAVAMLPSVKLSINGVDVVTIPGSAPKANSLAVETSGPAEAMQIRIGEHPPPPAAPSNDVCRLSWTIGTSHYSVTFAGTGQPDQSGGPLILWPRKED